MSIAELLAVVAAPFSPLETSGAAQWQQVQRQLGLALLAGAHEKVSGTNGTSRRPNSLSPKRPGLERGSRRVAGPDPAYARKKARDRLIRLAASHPDWVLGWQDETWWSRLTGEMLLRFVQGRPVSPVTEDFLA